MLWGLRKKFEPLYVVCPVLIIILVWPLYASNKSHVQWPKVKGPVAAGMVEARKLTPQDSIYDGDILVIPEPLEREVIVPEERIPSGGTHQHRMGGINENFDFM